MDPARSEKTKKAWRLSKKGRNGNNEGAQKPLIQIGSLSSRNITNFIQLPQILNFKLRGQVSSF